MADAREFYGLEPGPDLRHWSFVVTPGLCSTLDALFGGAALGASILALEQATERPVVWATAQFLSFARTASVVHLEVHEVVRGHRISQARVIGRVDGEEIFTVNAASGGRDVPYSGTWAEMPTLAPPDGCPPRVLDARHEGTIASRLETRVADARDFAELDGTPGHGRSALWIRMPELDVDASALAVIGDYVPFGIGQALGAPVGGNSLDNTLRIVHRRPDTEWVLADVRIHGIADGFGHGTVLLWSQGGTLLATASQSTILRPFHTPPRDERAR